VVGAGHADKHQIAMMLKILLPKAEPPSADAADALAIAITHAHHRQSTALRLKVVGYDRQAQGPDRFLRRGLRPPRRWRRRLPGALLSRTLQHLPGPARPPCCRSRLTSARSDKLFGFRTDQERECFAAPDRAGVGAKVALAVLGTLAPSDLANAIALRDKAAVARTPGVGPKVAERIVTELKDKAPAFANVDPAVVHLAGAIDDQRAPRPVADAISAWSISAMAAAGGRRDRGGIAQRG